MGSSPELGSFPAVCGEAKPSSVLTLTPLDCRNVLGSGFQPLMFPSTASALKRREHQPDVNAAADVRRRARSHPGGK